MKTLFKSFALATASVAAFALPSAPAAAQSRTGVATADFEAAITRSTAFTNAIRQIQTTYAAQITQIQTRTAALQADAKPQVDAYQAAIRAPNATEASVRPAAEALQRKQQAAQTELNRLNQPIALARAYVEEQIVRQLDPALRAAMTARKVDLLVQPQAVIAREPYVDITDAVVTELNRLVPSVQITPPAGWQPGQQQGAQPAAQTPAQPATQPQGR